MTLLSGTSSCHWRLRKVWNYDTLFIMSYSLRRNRLNSSHWVQINWIFCILSQKMKLYIFLEWENYNDSLFYILLFLNDKNQILNWSTDEIGRRKILRIHQKILRSERNRKVYVRNVKYFCAYTLMIWDIADAHSQIFVQ